MLWRIGSSLSGIAVALAEWRLQVCRSPARNAGCAAASPALDWEVRLKGMPRRIVRHAQKQAKTCSEMVLTCVRSLGVLFPVRLKHNLGAMKHITRVKLAAGIGECAIQIPAKAHIA